MMICLDPSRGLWKRQYGGVSALRAQTAGQLLRICRVMLEPHLLLFVKGYDEWKLLGWANALA
jgi:hypothetical protein